MSITLRQASCTFQNEGQQNISAVKEVSLNIQNGEFVGIMGQTGCGKTTLLQMMAGLRTPTYGQVLYDNQDIYASGFSKEVLRKNVGVIFQYPEQQLFETTVERDVAFGIKDSGFSQEEIRYNVKEALEMVGFSYEDIREQSPLSLSGGEKRKVAIAGVLVSKPKMLLVDEPIAGLNLGSCYNVMNLLTKLNEKGVTVVMISHDADIMCEYAKRILVMQEGCIQRDGTPNQIFLDSNKCREWSIGVSKTKQLANMLTERGINISSDTVTYSELLNEITAHFQSIDEV